MQIEQSARETRSFKMDKSLLWTIIRSQAGTLSKAVLELVMNAVDAGSTAVKIEVTRETLKVSDDGKGFTSRKEIEDFFETFGTPHIEGDATYGRFRMGRGMVMSFTKNHWRSGVFSMAVDIQNLGLEYELRTMPEVAPGCTIDCILYEPLAPSGVMRLIDELRGLCKYSPIPVIVNGERISQDLSTVRWTAEDDDAYYLIREAATSLEVFNLGVHVRDFWKGEFGVCGLVVSKRQLQLNFARNDVLANQCAVFKRIGAKLRSYAKATESERPRQGEAYRGMMMDRLLTGQFDTGEEFEEAISDAKTLTDFSGKHLSILSLASAVQMANGALVSVDERSIRADKVHQSKLAVVIDPKTMTRARQLTIKEILVRVEANYRSFHSGDKRPSLHLLDVLKTLQESVKELDVVGAMIDEAKKIIEPKEYTKDERLVLNVLRDHSWYFAVATDQRGTRRLGVFEAEGIDGFTDGASVVFLNRKFLKIGGTAGHIFRAFDALRSLMLHEYLHRVDDSRGHGHPAEFYEMFHQILVDNHRIRDFVYTAVRSYLALRRKQGAKMRAGDLTALDMVLMEQQGSTEAAVAADFVGAAEAQPRAESEGDSNGQLFEADALA